MCSSEENLNGLGEGCQRGSWRICLLWLDEKLGDLNVHLHINVAAGFSYNVDLVTWMLHLQLLKI